MLNKLKNKSKILDMVILIACIGLYLIFLIKKFAYINIPLMGDESYYAKINIFENFSNITQETFGHPPGFLLLLNTILLFVDYSTFVVHLTVYLFNTFLALMLFKILFRRRNVFYLSILISLLVTSQYINLGYTLFHPVIAMGLLISLAIFEFYNNRIRSFSIATFLAVSLRESALALPFVTLGLNRSKKVLWAIFPTILMMVCVYTYHYLKTRNILLSPQIELVINEKGKVWIFEFKHATKFYYQLYEGFGILRLLIWPAIAFLLIRGIQRKLIWTKTSLNFLFVFIIHSVFFAFYLDLALRNIFLSQITLSIFFLEMIYQNLELEKPITKLIISIITLTLCSVSYYDVLKSKDSLYNFKIESKMFINAGNTIKNIRKDCPKCDFISTNPYTDYLNLPHMGYVEKNLEIRSHGGVPGFTKIGNPDYIIMTKNHMDNFATQELQEHVDKNNHDIVFSETGEDGFELLIYKFKD